MSRDINLLHPDLQNIVSKFLKECEENGLIVKTTDTFRDKNEQNTLYAQGRTEVGKIVTNVKYPFSNHNWGIAFDFCRNDGKGAYNDYDNFFYKVGQIGKKYGLIWGGDWKELQDKPHFEYLKYGNAQILNQKYKTFEEFKKTWKEDEKSYMFLERNYKYENKIETFSVINENGENYIKVRDLAKLLNKKIEYKADEKITILDDILDNTQIFLDDKTYNIKTVKTDDFNFVKLRDIAQILGYEVVFDEKDKKIILSKTKNM